MFRFEHNVVAFAVLLAAANGCGEPECPSYLRTEGDDCVVPGEPDAGREQGTGERQSPQQTPLDGGVSRSNTSTAGEASQMPQDGGVSVVRGDAGSRTAAGAAGAAGAANAAGAGGMSTTSDTDASIPQTAMATCGNGKREGSELCDGADCPTECTSDNACIVTKLEGAAKTCDAKCAAVEVTMCGAADGCCPMSCNYGTDMDCSPSCGDGVLSGTETCEPGSTEHPCPSAADCDDRDICTEDSVTGSAQQCSAKCAYKPLTRRPIECDDGNPCTDEERVESTSACTFECVRSEPRRPTGSCVDDNPCTDDTPQMSTTACEMRCPHMPVRAGTPCGNSRMCSADGRCEEPPSECGDRVVSGTEACDVGARSTGNDGLPSGTVYDEWSCDENCRRLYLYTPCSADSQCGPGGWCRPDRGICGSLTKCQPGDPFSPSDTDPDRYNCELPNGRHGVCLSPDNCIPLCATAHECPDVGCLVIGAYSLCEIL